jgi:mercuric reductase
VPYLTNETAYFEPILPESLIVLGEGYVAVEAVQIFARLGSQVTLLQRSSHILSDTDEGLDLTGFLREEEIEVVAGLDLLSTTVIYGKATVTATSPNGQFRTFEASNIFVATGRAANTENVSDIPVQLSHLLHGGFIASHTLQTSMPGLYAAGDCVADSPQYVYTAAAEGKLAALNALASLKGQKETPMDHSVVP